MGEIFDMNQEEISEIGTEIENIRLYWWIKKYKLPNRVNKYLKELILIWTIFIQKWVYNENIDDYKQELKIKWYFKSYLNL